jgi:glycosyltransferase involved in cell wall biosynthesis
MMNVSTASVSVVIPCYRCADTIERAVKSVAEQTLKPYEVILVDDCSGDNTLEALYGLQKKYGEDWIKVIPLKENSGPGTARNVGWDASKQDYIAFLDSDDSWHPQKIEIQYSWMVNNSTAALTGHDCTQVSEKDTVPPASYSSEQANFYSVSKFKLLLSNRFPTRSVMLKRTILQRFPYGKRYSEDYHLWLDIVCSGLICYKLDWPLANLYKDSVGESGLSAAIWKMRKGELGCFSNIYTKKCIGLIMFTLLITYSLAKSARLFFILRFRKVFSG